MIVRPEPCEAHLEQAPPETRSQLEIADILRRFGPSYAQTHSVSPFEQRMIETSSLAEPPAWAVIGNAALSAALSGKPTTPVAIGIVLSVRASPR